eukprot:767509-Hanusia_phi.AAC.3
MYACMCLFARLPPLSRSRINPCLTARAGARVKLIGVSQITIKSHRLIQQLLTLRSSHALTWEEEEEEVAASPVSPLPSARAGLPEEPRQEAEEVRSPSSP